MLLTVVPDAAIITTSNGLMTGGTIPDRDVNSGLFFAALMLDPSKPMVPEGTKGTDSPSTPYIVFQLVSNLSIRCEEEVEIRCKEEVEILAATS